jgi:hypothetical protein
MAIGVILVSSLFGGGALSRLQSGASAAEVRYRRLARNALEWSLEIARGLLGDCRVSPRECVPDRVGFLGHHACWRIAWSPALMLRRGTAAGASTDVRLLCELLSVGPGQDF